MNEYTHRVAIGAVSFNYNYNIFNSIICIETMKISSNNWIKRTTSSKQLSCLRAFWFIFLESALRTLLLMIFLYRDFHFGIKKAINAEWKHSSSRSSTNDNDNPNVEQAKGDSMLFLSLMKNFESKREKIAPQFICVYHSSRTWLTLSLVMPCFALLCYVCVLWNIHFLRM